MLLNRTPSYVSVALLLGLVLLAYGLYAPGLSAGFQFDDDHTLAGLSQIHDVTSALVYILSGDTGPLGRPISLATFVLNAADWPNNPQGFLHLNVGLHILNGLLLFCVAHLLAKYLPETSEHRSASALTITALWLMHPLWVSTVLVPVQRMTILSTTFVLAGLLIYLLARGQLGRRPTLSTLLMLASLMIGGMLAALSKENGVVLPIMAGLVECLIAWRQTTVTSPPALGRVQFPWKLWRNMLVGGPIIILLIYVIVRWPHITAGFAIREFTQAERLLSEARILWDYLGSLLLPRPAQVTLFHDDYPYSTGFFEPVSTMVSVIAWAVVVILSWVGRHRVPLLTFAVFWFVLGHGIESSVFSLELYFQHRNYLPSIGLVIGLVYSLWCVPQKIRKMVSGLAVVYLGLLALLLFQTTLIWGQPDLAASLWWQQKPKSVRAALNFASYLTVHNKHQEASAVIQKSHRELPGDPGLSLLALLHSCARESPLSFKQSLDATVRLLENAAHSNAAVDGLNIYLTALERNNCHGLSYSDVHRLADVLIKNPKFQAHNVSMSHLHHIKARLHWQTREFSPMMKHFELGYRLHPSKETAMLIAGLYASAGLSEQGIMILDQSLADAPSNPILRAAWVSEFNKLRNAIDKMGSR